MADHYVIAVLGTGIMGAPMARNLLKAGHDVHVWNRSPEKAGPLADDGAHVADTPAEAVAEADIIVTVLYDGSTALDVMTQAATAVKPGAVWVQSATSGLGQIAELAHFAAENGIVFIDAPVLGTRLPAEAGQLTVLAAGPEEQQARLAPVFDAIGARTVWLGDDGATGAATRLKLVTNTWVLTVTSGVAEALSLAQGLGIDAAAFLDVVAGGPLDMGYLRVMAGAILGDRFMPPNVAVTTAAKDANLIVEAGKNHGVRLDVAEATAERFRRATEKGHGESDLVASYHASFDNDPA